MERILYFDCYSGASGDMLLGACLDAGAPVELLRETVSALGLGADIQVTRVRRAGIEATKVSVTDQVPASDHGSHPHRHLSSILRLIDAASLPANVREKSRALFLRLAEAEAAVHGVSPERVHFHEVGAVDSIVDIVGAVALLEWFDATTVVASAMNTGSGSVRCAHGDMPVPAPATARLLVGRPIYAEGPAVELLTPTGALLVTGYATSHGPLPAMTLARTGYGAGDRDFPGRSNVLRILVGSSLDVATESATLAGPSALEAAVVVEAQIDDLNPQIFGPLMTRLFAAGALDVFYTAVQMKKTRPGTLVTVVVRPSAAAAMVDVLFAETTTLGVRCYDVRRETLARDLAPIETVYGTVRIKVGRRHGQIVNAAPEFEDCVTLAQAAGVPVKEVLAEASQAWRTQQAASGKR